VKHAAFARITLAALWTALPATLLVAAKKAPPAKMGAKKPTPKK